MYLQDAERRRLAEDAEPGGGIELVLPGVERDRVGTIGTAERTAVRQLGKEAERLVQGGGIGQCHVTHALMQSEVL